MYGNQYGANGVYGTNPQMNPGMMAAMGGMGMGGMGLFNGVYMYSGSAVSFQGRL